MSVDAATPTLEGYTATASPLAILVMVTSPCPYEILHGCTVIVPASSAVCSKPKLVFFSSLLPTVMNDGCLGSGCFLSQLRGRKTEMEGGGKRGGGGGQTGGIWFLWEKLRFLCTWPSVTVINIAS